MRLIFYLFILSKFFYVTYVSADNHKKESLGSDSIKWEKIEETKSNESKIINKILWKSYKGDESYFQNDYYHCIFPR